MPAGRCAGALDGRSALPACDPGGMIVGLGVDVVNVPRFTATLASVSALRGMYFADDELVDADGQPRSAPAMAMRYAAKEAVAKALGVPSGLRHTDCRVTSGERGEPALQITGSVAAAADERGVTRWHVSMSYEGDIATALVIAEADGQPRAA